MSSNYPQKMKVSSKLDVNLIQNGWEVLTNPPRVALSPRAPKTFRYLRPKKQVFDVGPCMMLPDPRHLPVAQDVTKSSYRPATVSCQLFGNFWVLRSPRTVIGTTFHNSWPAGEPTLEAVQPKFQQG